MSMGKKTKIILVTLSSLVVIGACIAGFFLWRNHKSDRVTYSTTKIKRGDISHGITATGNLNDSLSVDVGTQVSGIISQIFVDFNDVVKKGQVIAMIDTVPLSTQVTDARAALYKAQTTLLQQEREFNRYKELLSRKAVNQSDYDVQEASYNSALSAFQSATADLERAKTNLSYATIHAPIKGVIINRNVNVGQTVAASFSTPTLFTIGNDPHVMQVTASIDEADIGWLQKGQDVDFTVETYPDRVYTGKVFQIRLQAITNQNVVTYNVMINVRNDDLTLLPGMTAILTVKVAEHKNVLLVPVSALLFNPFANDSTIYSTDNNKQTIWVYCGENADSTHCINAKGTYMYCDTVRRVLDDGVMAEIEGHNIHEGMKIITGVVKEQAKKTKSLLPSTTMPHRPGQPRPGG